MVVKTAQLSLIFIDNGPALQKYCGPRDVTTQAASTESVSLLMLVGVARGLIGSNRSNRLKAGLLLGLLGLM